MTLSFNDWIANPSKLRISIICFSVWVVPFITGTVALILDKIAPASGNWCWIAPKPLWLRYVLGHAWRLAIFLVVITLYIVIFLRVRRRLRARGDISQQGSYAFTYRGQGTGKVARRAHEDPIFSTQPATLGLAEKDLIATPPPAANRSAFLSTWTLDDDPGAANERPKRRRLSLKPRLTIVHSCRLDKEMWHWFMLSMFPLSYILLWIPGVANRLLELAGSSNKYVTAFQATTQLTGLANAGLYGWREHRGFWRRLKWRWYYQC